ncbi:ZIP metal ion transporter-like protein [Diplocarpon rosae]|nr:ZIP metal ion transporter-like protein [Diplocarpon rosae]
MLDGLFMLLGLSVVMALASFLAGALPLSMTLSSSQLRLISTIGMGVLVGTSLIVIIPEGIEAAYTAGEVGHLHTRRHQLGGGEEVQWVRSGVHTLLSRNEEALPAIVTSREENESEPGISTSPIPSETSPNAETAPTEDEEHHDPPTFYIGFSLILGFILMFLIDKLPRHAQEHIQPPPATRHISLDNLSLGMHSARPSSPTSPDAESFLHSLAPSPKQTRSLATTTGLVIHAAADGIAMGASASGSNTKLGVIIFVAILIHKAPAAFGLTSVLLKQGLSKRAARGHLIIFSLAAPFGALSTWMLVNILGGEHMEGARGQWWTGMLLLFSAGTFLYVDLLSLLTSTSIRLADQSRYVAMHAMQEDAPLDSSPHAHFTNGYADASMQRKQPKPQMRDTLAAVGGMLIPLLTQIGHHH